MLCNTIGGCWDPSVLTTQIWSPVSDLLEERPSAHNFDDRPRVVEVFSGHVSRFIFGCSAKSENASARCSFYLDTYTENVEPILSLGRAVIPAWLEWIFFCTGRKQPGIGVV